MHNVRHGEFGSGPPVVKQFSDTGKNLEKAFRNKFGIINPSYALELEYIIVMRY